jgi:outer membrane cobalamin receptor
MMSSLILQTSQVNTNNTAFTRAYTTTSGMFDSDDETETQWLEECKLFSRAVTVRSDNIDKIVEEMKLKDQEEYKTRDTLFIDADNELEESICDIRMSVQPPDEEK